MSFLQIGEGHNRYTMVLKRNQAGKWTYGRRRWKYAVSVLLRLTSSTAGTCALPRSYLREKRGSLSPSLKSCNPGLERMLDARSPAMAVSDQGWRLDRKASLLLCWQFAEAAGAACSGARTASFSTSSMARFTKRHCVAEE